MGTDPSFAAPLVISNRSPRCLIAAPIQGGENAEHQPHPGSGENHSDGDPGHGSSAGAAGSRPEEKGTSSLKSHGGHASAHGASHHGEAGAPRAWPWTPRPYDEVTNGLSDKGLFSMGLNNPIRAFFIRW